MRQHFHFSYLYQLCFDSHASLLWVYTQPPADELLHNIWLTSLNGKVFAFLRSKVTTLTF